MLSQVSSEQEGQPLVDHHVHTVQYTKDNFSSEIKKKNHFVMFYAPWYV